MAEKKKLTKGVSPAGVASFPFLNKPDEYKGKKNFKVTLTIGGDESAEFRAKIEAETEKVLAETRAAIEEKLAGAKDGKTKAKLKSLLEELETGLPFSPAVDDDGEETGDFEFKFKCGAEFEDKKTGDMKQIIVPIFNAKKVHLNPKGKNAPSIWGGSTLKVAYALAPYFVEGAKVCGVSLRIEGVQVIELVSGGGGRSADALGFGEEDGYDENAADSEDEDDSDGLPSAGGDEDEEDF